MSSSPLTAYLSGKQLRMQIIADSGSTKTRWAIVNGQVTTYFETRGFHPAYLEPRDASVAICEAWPTDYEALTADEIHFYGAGCLRKNGSDKMRSILGDHFTAAKINVYSDLEGAAKSTLGQSPGIAAILGTGSSAALWNGTKLSRVSPSLGYLLGDEGSGADLGKTLLRDIFYGNAPDEISQAFYKRYPQGESVIISGLHSANQPSALLGTYALTLKDFLDHPYVKTLVTDRFRLFIKELILALDPGLEAPIGLNGSVADTFGHLLLPLLNQGGMRKVTILADPLPALVDWHTSR